MATRMHREDFEGRCQSFRRRLTDADFLMNKGLGNEMGIYTFCYDPTLELEARAYFDGVVADAKAGAFDADGIAVDIHHENLYDVFMAICDEARITQSIPKMEMRQGRERLLPRIQQAAPASKFVERMDWPGHKTGDVLLVTGVGQVYPFLRAHDLLNTMQATFQDIPVVLAYPGSFDGGKLTLFNRLHDQNYYRAFDLI